MRLELLEAVSSYYGGGDAAATRERLLSAQAKWRRLAVADDALASLVGMGFTSSEVGSAMGGIAPVPTSDGPPWTASARHATAWHVCTQASWRSGPFARTAITPS